MKDISFEEFVKNFEKESEMDYFRAHYVIHQVLNGLEVPVSRLDAAKYRINRKDGLPTAKIGGDSDKPIIHEVEIKIKK